MRRSFKYWLLKPDSTNAGYSTWRISSEICEGDGFICESDLSAACVDGVDTVDETQVGTYAVIYCSDPSTTIGTEPSTTSGAETTVLDTRPNTNSPNASWTEPSTWSPGPTTTTTWSTTQTPESTTQTPESTTATTWWTTTTTWWTTTTTWSTTQTPESTTQTPESTTATTWWTTTTTWWTTTTTRSTTETPESTAPAETCRCRDVDVYGRPWTAQVGQVVERNCSEFMADAYGWAHWFCRPVGVGDCAFDADGVDFVNCSSRGVQDIVDRVSRCFVFFYFVSFVLSCQ